MTICHKYEQNSQVELVGQSFSGQNFLKTSRSIVPPLWNARSSIVYVWPTTFSSTMRSFIRSILSPFWIVSSSATGSFFIISVTKIPSERPASAIPRYLLLFRSKTVVSLIPGSIIPGILREHLTCILYYDGHTGVSFVENKWFHHWKSVVWFGRCWFPM